jgi:anthranilate synthase component 2
VDNYDSFTFNLVQIVRRSLNDVRVVRNNEVTIEQVRSMKPSRIIISPGPGRPEQAGLCVELIHTFGTSIPILGVCLGHQAIGFAFGARIVHAPHLMHGKSSAICHDGRGIFRHLPQPFEATRYHSLVIDPTSLPAELIVTARTHDGTIMGVRHAIYPINGVQFHPESILTTVGPTLIANWLSHQGVPA